MIHPEVIHGDLARPVTLKEARNLIDNHNNEPRCTCGHEPRENDYFLMNASDGQQYVAQITHLSNSAEVAIEYAIHARVAEEPKQ